MTQTDTPPSNDAIVERYLTFWNARSGPEQRRLATTVFREDFDHRGPLGARVGVDQVLQLGLGFAEHLGEVTFRVRNQPQAHHGRVRLQWEALRGEESFAEGTDVLAVDENGLIESVTTFLDRAPEGFDPHEH